ncbi:hypothetical protein DENSPDRAFT_845180 [Dentipellis sp. KUC8613]|nr:hypothetical protein DENSPDRAFT_845180 [Dentipellis sp. KUC8613]
MDIPGKFSSPEPVPTPAVPATLERATLRLNFPPSYVVVGAYRMLTDKTLFVPVWKKCKHAFLRGIAVGAGWAVVSFKLQRWFVRLFMMKSPTIAGMSDRTVFGVPVPFDVPTYATAVFLSAQLTTILLFFLGRSLRVARERAWAQTVASRGKGPEFWQPYVEEWPQPPVVNVSLWAGLEGTKGFFISFALKRLILLPLHVVPFAGVVISAWFRAFDTARYLHRPYYEAKHMTRQQIAIFVVEHKWEYRAFGFTAALLEYIPILGLLFSVSNRVGAAMWAHDLEKRQHYVAEQQRKRLS